MAVFTFTTFTHKSGRVSWRVKEEKSVYMQE